MSKKAFDKIMSGLKEALGVVRGEIPVERVDRGCSGKDGAVVLRTKDLVG